MKLLVDTHAFVWSLARSRRLPERVRQLMEDRSNQLLVSTVSAYEIEFKRPRSAELSRLPSELEQAALEIGYTWLPISISHAIAAGRLPRLYGDPFDRLLAAQALVENLSLITRDPAIKAYGAPTMW